MTVRADNTSYILVSESGRVVPLPFHTAFMEAPVTVIGGEPPRPELVGTVEVMADGEQYTCPAEWCGLQWITEAEYMESQTCAK